MKSLLRPLLSQLVGVDDTRLPRDSPLARPSVPGHLRDLSSVGHWVPSDTIAASFPVTTVPLGYLSVEPLLPSFHILPCFKHILFPEFDFICPLRCPW